MDAKINQQKYGKKYNWQLIKNEIEKLGTGQLFERERKCYYSLHFGSKVKLKKNKVNKLLKSQLIVLWDFPCM